MVIGGYIMFDDVFLKDTYEYFFKGKHYNNKRTACDKVLKQWEQWKTKIVSDSLEIDEYVNRKEKDDYFVYFLNNTSSVYGRSREGNAEHWMVKMNKDGESYYVGSYTNEHNRKVAEQLNANKADAEVPYNSLILPLLKKIIKCCDSINNLKNLEMSDNYNWFLCKQMLEKMMVLESVSDCCNSNIKYCLLNIYKRDIIDMLYDEGFGLSGEDTQIGKSYEIMKKCYELLNIDVVHRSAETQYEISQMLWELATCVPFSSEDSPNVILYGSPGTGKTYEVTKAIRYFTKNNQDRFVFVQCHPGFGYEDFIEGIKPVGISNKGTLNLEIVNGIFKDFCIKAKKDPKNEYYFVADEINRANLSSMFGETLSLLEPDYRDDNDPTKLRKTPLSKMIETYIKQKNLCEDEINSIAYSYNQTDGVLFGIPKNIRFIGMMNDVDKSIDSFDLALRRRFKWIRKDCDYEVITDRLFEQCDWNEIDSYVNKCKKLNEFISQKDDDCLGFGRSYEFGHAYYLKIKPRNKKITKRAYEKLFDEHLKPVLAEYIRSFKDDDEIDLILKKAKSIFVD